MTFYALKNPALNHQEDCNLNVFFLLSKGSKGGEKANDVRKLIEKANHKQAKVCSMFPFFRLPAIKLNVWIAGYKKKRCMYRNRQAPNCFSKM